MPSLPKSHTRGSYAKSHATKSERPWAQWYSHSRWRKVRARHLAKQPLCAFCEAKGYVTVAAVVDHIEPHKGDRALFYNEANLQSLCKRCHDSDKAIMEQGAGGNSPAGKATP